MLNLRYFVPGDQDFAAGTDFLVNLSKKHKFQFVLTNAAANNPIKHIKYDSIEFAGKKYFFLGLVPPNLLTFKDAQFYTQPIKALEATIKKLEQEHGKINVILLSHMSLKTDKLLARKFPQLKVIVGSHDQAFLQKLEKENEAVIVQVLSRNHYLGKLDIKSNGEFGHKLHEMRDEVAQQKPNNEFVPWLTDFKSKLQEIQQQENAIGGANLDSDKIRTYLSCQSCHQDQFAFWQGTSHALALKTLVDAKAQDNPNCIDCHSIGFKNKKGFYKTSQIVHGKAKVDTKKYLAELTKIFSFKKSVRSLSSRERKAHSDKWLKLDEKFGISHNFANVQCLHCHEPALNHPMDIADDKPEINYANKCMKCHTADQSPEWYHKNDKGIADKPNLEYFAKKIEQITCPM
jgi:nitrate/TMAO reductase-like tetraheme cytochrome c subunit